MPPRGVKKEPVAEVLYPFVSVAICASPEKSGVSIEQAERLREAFASFGHTGLISYCPPLTATDAAVLFGIETESPDGPKFGTEYLFTDVFDRKVRCTKNVRNRPIHASTYEAYEQDILNLRWELNGETIIIGRSGVTVDGQHQLAALWRAQQRLDTEKDMDSKELRWAKNWPDGVVKMDKIVVYGIEESDRVVNTINTARPRTFADVLYRSPFFADMPAKGNDGLSRETAAKVCDAAIKTMWTRTGLYMDSYSPRRTHSEGIGWLEGHGGMRGRFLRCVRHVMEETRYTVKVKDPLTEEFEDRIKTDKIRGYVPLGYAAAAMYLMAQSDTAVSSEDLTGRTTSPVQAYYAAEEPSDKFLDWGKWDKACEFWSAFGKTDGPLAALTKQLQEFDRQDANNVTTDYIRFEVKDYVIASAWKWFRDGKDVTRKHISVRYSKPDPRTGRRTLVDVPTFGGIDFGAAKVHKNPEDGLDPTPEEREEVENGIEELRNGHAKGDAAPAPDDPEGMPERLQKQFPDHTILFTRAAKYWNVWGFAADLVGEVVGESPGPGPHGVPHLKFKNDDMEELVEALTDREYTVGLVTEDAGAWVLQTTYRPKRRKEKK